MEGNYIRHHRKEMDSYVWSLKPEYYKVWQTILLNVNWKESTMDFAGEPRTIKPGQMVTGYEDLAQKAGKGVTIQNVRTAIEKFEKTDMVTTKSTNKGTLLTVVNWGEYQKTPNSGNKQTNNQATNEQQSTNNQLTTYEKGNKGNKGNKEHGISDEARSCFDKWQDCDGTITHRSRKTEHRKAIQRRLDDGFEEQEIKKAIDRLNELYVGNKNTWLTTEWTCKEFFTTKSGAHLEKMVQKPQHFLNKNDKNGTEKSERAKRIERKVG